MVLVTQNDMGGLGRALEQVGGAFGQAMLQRGENQFYKNLFNPQSSTQDLASQRAKLAQDESFGDQFLSMLQDYENQSGNMLSPRDVDFLWDSALSSAMQNSQPQGEYSSAQLGAIARKNPQLAKLIQDQQIANQKYRQKEEFEMSKRAYEENKPFVADMEKARDSIAQEEVNINRINEALDSGNVRTWQNFLADYFDNEYLRTAEGSDLLSATKEAFITDMQQMPTGTRLNQYLEKNMREALQTVGKNEKSNRKITAYQQFKNDLKKEKLQVYDKIRNEFVSRGLEPPRNFKALVDEQVKGYTNARQKALTQEFKDIDSGKNLPQTRIKEEAREILRTPAGTEEMMEMTSMPAPAKHSGRIIEETATGKKYRSDGKRWKEVK